MLSYPTEFKDYFICVGSNRLRVVRNEGRWGEPEPGWSVNGAYGYLDDHTWARVVDFQTPVEMDSISKNMIKKLQLNPSFDMDYFIKNAPYGIEMDRKIRIGGGSTIMQISVMTEEALNFPKTGYCEDGFFGMGRDHDFMRMLSFLGEPTLREWNWFDRSVRLPVAKLLARFLTWLSS
jgi:hypothetical protein